MNIRFYILVHISHLGHRGLEKGRTRNDDDVRAASQPERIVSDIQSITQVKFIYFTHFLCPPQGQLFKCIAFGDYCSHLQQTNCVFNNISMQKCPWRKEKKQGKEGGEEEKKNLQNVHEKLLQSSWGKQFFIKAVSKNKHLILNEFQLILNIS